MGPENWIQSPKCQEFGAKVIQKLINGRKLETIFKHGVQAGKLKLLCDLSFGI